MKTKATLAILMLLTLTAIVSAVVLGHRIVQPGSAEHARVFEVRGEIRDVDVPNKIIRIAHEAIRNYMPAMTMPLTVKDAGLLRSFKAGDNVQFELVVTSDDSWISRMEKIQSEAAAAGASPTPNPGAPARNPLAEPIHQGEVVPDFSLVDQDGKLFHLRGLRGKAVVLTFIYTRCPLPNFCPAMSKNFAALQQRLSQAFPGKFRLLSITMDPEFDRPEVLTDYGSLFGADKENWIFGTGSADQIGFVADLMGLYYQQENGLISHDLRTALIAPDGRLVRVWKSNVWTPYEMQREVGEALGASKVVASR